MSSVLVLLLLGEVWWMLQAGGRFYLRVRSQTSIQKSALIGLRWFTKDLAEGAPLSFRHYDPENPAIETVHNGLVFGSPKDLNEVAVYNDTGRLMWPSVIGYYIEPETNTLFRTKVLLDEPQRRAPQILDDIHHIDLLAEEPLRRAVAHNVINIKTEQGTQNLEIKLHCRDEEVGFGLTVRTRLEMKNK